MMQRKLILLLSIFTACVSADLEGTVEVTGTESKEEPVIEQGPCGIEPICSAFRTGGDGEVAVTIDPTGEFAIVKSNGLANHAMGPYGMSPHTHSAQDYNFRIPVTPATNKGGELPRGPIAVAFNGVPFFGPREPEQVGTCNGNSGTLSGDRTDSYGGSTTPNGNYHYYAGQFLGQASALGITHSTSAHSPIIGYALDGYPIYGPYGYKERDDAKSGIGSLRSCYKLKAARTCCTDNAVCGTSAKYHGRALELGSFVEDFEYSQASHDAGACDLNEYNMRLQATPDYPEGTWAYILTVDAGGKPVFPFLLGPTYYGEAPAAP